MGDSLAGRLAAVVLGVVLLVAGIAKRADRGWPRDAAAMETPAWAIPVLPWLEILLGAVLVSGVARPAAAALAGLVLLAFTGLVVLNLAPGGGLRAPASARALDGRSVRRAWSATWCCSRSR